MQEVLGRLFNEHGFIKQWETGSEIKFYTNSDKSLVSYFIVNYIDCTSFENDENAVKEVLNALEKRYMNFEKQDESLKKSIAKTFSDINEVAQIDKNTSAIYVMKFSDMSFLDKYRNIIYAIEESSIYFKRYILAYNETQLLGLKKVISDYEDKTIESILTDLADDEENYYQLLRGENHSTYELVIRFFSKIPFLQYNFKAASEEYSLVEMVNSALNSELKKYDDLVSGVEDDIEKYLALIQDEISDDYINNELDKLLGGIIK